MRTKEIFVDFYVVELPAGSRSLVDALQDHFSLTPESRNFGEADPLRLEAFTKDADGNVSGDFLRVRMQDLPNVAPLDGATPSRPLSDLGVTDAEGIGRSTAFFFNAEHSVIALQRNRAGATSDIVRRYIERLSDYGSSVSFLPVLERDAYASLASWNRIRSIQVEVVNPQNLEHLKGHADTDSAIAKATDIGGSRISLRVDVNGQRGASLARNRALSFLRNLMTRGRQQDEGPVDEVVTKLEAVGADAESNLEPVDLLGNAITFSNRLQIIDPLSRRYRTRDVSTGRLGRAIRPNP